jgi:hypothetical protein
MSPSFGGIITVLTLVVEAGNNKNPLEIFQGIFRWNII